MTNTLGAYLEQEIMSAEPLELVCMLYQAAIMEVRDARRHLASANVPARCAAIAKASDMIGEMLSSLKTDEGQEITSQLASLYRYSLAKMLEANLTKTDAPLADVLGILTTLGEGWQGILEERRKRTPDVNPNAAMFLHAPPLEYAAQSWSF